MPALPEIANWRALRLALGLTQKVWAEILCVSVRHIKWLEAGACKAGGPLTALALSWSNDPEARERLIKAGYPVAPLEVKQDMRPPATLIASPEGDSDTPPELASLLRGLERSSL